MNEVRAERVAGIGLRRVSTPAFQRVPVSLRSASIQTVKAGRFPPPTGRQMVLIKWVIHGEAAIGVEGRRLRFKPGEVAVYVPSIPHEFWAITPACQLCWFSVDGPVIEEFALALGLTAGVYNYGEPPLAMIEQMLEVLKDHTAPGYRRASLQAIQLLYEVADRVSTEVPSVVQQAQQLIHAEFSNPELSVDTIAERLHYHRGALSRVFHKHAGTTIIQYMTHVRLHHARTLLLHTEQRISDIAVRCGFRETNYFCRWISKHTGTSPSHLRREALV